MLNPPKHDDTPKHDENLEHHNDFFQGNVGKAKITH